jgi:hypothetical protein
MITAAGIGGGVSALIVGIKDDVILLIITGALLMIISLDLRYKSRW